MSLIDCREQFRTGKIAKPDYIENMYQLHKHLFEYSDFIKQTDIGKIEIEDGKVILTSRTSGVKLVCESLDKRMAPIEILNFDSYEKTDFNMVLRLLDNEMTFFDIGANIGWYSLNAAKRYSNLNIYSFEPIPYTFDILEKNTALNNFSNIKLFNMAFSNKDQDMTFYFDPLSSGSASARNLLENKDIQKIDLSATTLDSFFVKNNFQQLDFIKCDVEGAELFVFRGGVESIKKYQPIIFTEMLRKWSAKFNYHPNEIIILLTELGYRCFEAKEDKLVEFFQMDENTIGTNFFFLHTSKHASKIRDLTD